MHIAESTLHTARINICIFPDLVVAKELVMLHEVIISIVEGNDSIPEQASTPAQECAIDIKTLDIILQAMESLKEMMENLQDHLDAPIGVPPTTTGDKHPLVMPASCSQIWAKRPTRPPSSFLC